MSEEKPSYNSDYAETDPARDEFKRRTFAKRLAGTLSARTDPESLVIGIYGAWGEGKTTILHFIEKELENAPQVVCVWFNPWRFTDEDRLLKAFFKTVADAIDRSLSTTTEKIGEKLKKYALALSPISFSINDPASGGAAMKISLAESVKDFGEVLSTVELDELKRRIQQALKDAGIRVVVLLDDIDRLDRTEVQTVFRLIKLTADFSYTAYVLSFDEKIVAAALGERYGAGNKKEGRRFLEKIVNVPLTIPKADKKALRGFCFNLLNQVLSDSKIELTEKEIEAFLEQFRNLELRLSTPRMAKRYANALAFSLPIFQGEVNLLDVMLLEGIRVFYPRAFRVIRDDPDTFVGSEETDALQMIVSSDEIAVRRDDALDSALKGLSADARGAATKLLHFLFPRLKGPAGARHARSITSQRVSERKYFRRYFAYGTPTGDISDRELDDFLKYLELESKDDLTRRMQTIILEVTAGVFADELRGKADKLAPKASHMLANLLAESGDLFPFSWGRLSACHLAALVVAKLIGNLQMAERAAAAETLIGNAEPLTFAVEIYKSIAPEEAERDDNTLLAATDEQKLGRVLAERIKEFGGERPIFREADGGFLLSSWAHLGSRDETNEYLSKSFEEPANALEFIQLYFPTEWPFARSSYDSVAQKVDPEIVYSAIRSLYGSRLDSATYDHGDQGSKSDLAAYQFAHVYRMVKEATNNEGPDSS